MRSQDLQKPSLRPSTPHFSDHTPPASAFNPSGTCFKIPIRPFSEDLASAVDVAPLLFDFEETQKRSGWGGTYSVFSSHAQYEGDGDDPYRMLVSVAKSANPIALELAATAAYLASVGEADPWGETERRKPEKTTDGRLDLAKTLYGRFKSLPLPESLPDI
jgi:hypothetical protein